MNLSKDSKFTICTHCNHIITSYVGQNQICLRKFHSSHSSQNNQKNKSNVTATRSIQTNKVNKYENKLIDTTGNSKLDEFIEETQNNSKYCDDFIEWIPNNYLENVNHLAKGGNSNIFCGTWNLTIPLAIKSIKDTGDQFLNEFKMHHKCRSQSVIPFYGITKIPGRNEYAMVIRRAKYGDLRNYIRDFFPKLTWADRIEILINISKALKHIHEMNLIHRDFHCKNVLVDENRSILICDFGLCTPVDLEIASDKKIQGVLPYIAPEVLRNKPYTKKSEVYSLSMIMWELTSNEPPFSDHPHDKYLAIQIVKGQRPDIIKETPNFYAKFMEQCWDPDPSKRPDSSDLPELFEEMMVLCKNLKYDKVSPNFSLIRNIERKTESDKSLGYTLSIPSFDFTKNDDERVSVVNDDIKSSPQSNLPTNSKEKSTRPERKTESDKSLEYTLSIPSFDFTENDDERVSVVNDDIKSSPQSNLPTNSNTSKYDFSKIDDASTNESTWSEQYKKASLEKEILQSSQKFDTEASTNAVRKQAKQEKKTEKTAALITLKSKTTPETIKKIVENQKPDGSFKLDKTVSEKINISSDNIQSSIQTYGVSDKLKSVPKNVWETVLSLRYLTITSQSEDQHKEQSEKGKKYLIEELKDKELVEELLTTSEKIIVEKCVEKEKKDTVATIQNSTTTEKAKEIVSSRKEDGSLELTDTVYKELDVESIESLVSSIKTYFINKETKVPESKKLIDTAITLSFLRKTSSTDTSPELKEKVEKAEKYLTTELGNEEKVKELLEKTDIIVVEHATKKVVKEKADQVVVGKVQETITEEEITEVIETQNNEGSYEKISDKITEKLGVITTENISSSIRITDERVKKFDTKVWNTFITIAYCNKVLGKQQSKVTTPNEKALAWLHTQIKDEKLVKEVLESCEKIVVEKVSNKKKDESTTTIWPSLTDWGSSWGKYIADTVKSTTEGIYEVARQTTDSVQHTADTVSSTLVNLKSKTTPETTKKIVENQKPDGSIKLDKTVSDQINISSDNIQSSVQTYGVSDKLKSVPKNVWETALSLRYLTITSQSQDQHKEQSEKAKKYLIEELKDEKLVEELLTTSEKIIVDQSVKKEKEDAVSTIQSSTTTEKAKEIVSSQKEDGSLELPDTVSKALDVESSESLVSSIKTYFINKGTKAPEDKKLLDTAITLSFLRKTSSTDTSPELKEKVAKAEKYLKTELGSDEKIKELLEKTDTVVVDHAVKKVIKEKAEQTIVQEIQETVTEEEEITKVIGIQNNEGSYEKISDKITEKLGEITTKNISSSIRITDERVKKFDTKVWNTFITIAYCNKVLGKHKSKWTNQNAKALAWLHEQIKDEKLEKEILESCEKIVVEKVSNKKKESSPWFNLLPTWGSSDTTKQTTIKKIESIPVAPTTSTTKSPEKPKESVVSKLAEKFSGTPSTGSPSTAIYPKKDTRKAQPKKDQPTPETESKMKSGWFDNIATTEKANHEIEDSRYNTQTYDFSLDDLN
ncbi:unnamed protein product [Rhizophagus irregularis]|nr:unnamed protein product [Rhizophagus irregularis]